MKGLIKIAITGPESTGKSRLATGLAEHFNTLFVPEFARTYIDELARPYEQADLVEIARGQLSAEAEAEKKANDYLFCDTDMLVMKIWSLHRYGSCDPFILEALQKQNHDLYLLGDIDLPWEYDPQREHPHLRQYFFNWYRKELEEYGLRYSVVSGKGEERLQCAINAVEKVGRYEGGKMGKFEGWKI